MGWLSGGLAVVCGAVGLFHAIRLAVRRDDVAGELAHAAMGLGMAAMLSPLGDPVPAPVWAAVFTSGAVWFAAAVLHRRSLAGDGPHHVVGSGAMLFMLVVGHGGIETLGVASLAAMALAAYFAWYALRCAERCRRSAPAAGPGGGTVALGTPVRSRVAPQLAAGHLVMAVAMTVMLVGAV